MTIMIITKFAIVYRAHHGVQTRNIMAIMVMYRAHHGVQARIIMAIMIITKFAIVS